MTRSDALLAMARAQVSSLRGALAGAAPAQLREPCPGREQLGDGSIGTVAGHVTGNFERVAELVAGGGTGREGAGPRTPRRLRFLGRRRPAHDMGATARDPAELVVRLDAVAARLGGIGGLSDEALDAVPPTGSFRFADGRRSLEQLLSAVLKHQQHQVAAITTALSDSAS